MEGAILMCKAEGTYHSAEKRLIKIAYKNPSFMSSG
jgi:hypothetical protein